MQVPAQGLGSIGGQMPAPEPMGDDLLTSYGLGLDLSFSEQEQAHITQLAHQQHQVGQPLGGRESAPLEGHPAAKKMRTDL
jgi:hypothetical protein